MLGSLLVACVWLSTICSILFLAEVENQTLKIVLAAVAFVLGFLVGLVYFLVFEKKAAILDNFKASTSEIQQALVKLLSLPVDFQILNNE